jgi:hypothetical protein
LPSSMPMRASRVTLRGYDPPNAERRG